ncbi:MAG: sulfotransferase domain-containing protein [Pseudomonadota bacterium]
MRKRITRELGIHRAKLPFFRDVEPARTTDHPDSAAVARRYRLHVATLALVRAARRVKHLHTDAYVLSYPKCGRTWLRLMLGHTFRTHFGLDDVPLLETKTFAKRQPGIPRLQFTHDDDPFLRPVDRLQQDKRRYRDRSVIFLVRDPRDVVVSFYFQMLKRDRIIEGSLGEFVFAERGGLPSIIAFYNIWARNMNVPRAFLLLRYEDMHARPAAELRRVVDFLGLAGIDDAVLAETARFASFDAMQRMEREGTAGSFRLTPGDPNDIESFKVRRGVVGGYLDYLSAAEIARAEALLADHLDPVYGYGWSPMKAAAG